MPQYTLQLRDHSGIVIDPYVIDCSCLDKVKERALQEARDTISHDIRDGVFDLRFCIDIQDQTGVVVFTLPFEDAVKVLRD